MSERPPQLVNSSGLVDKDVWERVKTELLVDRWQILRGALYGFQTRQRIEWEDLAQAPNFAVYVEAARK